MKYVSKDVKWLSKQELREAELLSRVYGVEEGEEEAHMQACQRYLYPATRELIWLREENRRMRRVIDVVKECVDFTEHEKLGRAVRKLDRHEPHEEPDG